MDKEEIKEAFREVLEEEGAYSDHREFVEHLMEKQKRRDARWEKIKTQVVGWSIISALTFIGTAVGQYVMNRNS